MVDKEITTSSPGPRVLAVVVAGLSYFTALLAKPNLPAAELYNTHCNIWSTSWHGIKRIYIAGVTGRSIVFSQTWSMHAGTLIKSDA